MVGRSCEVVLLFRTGFAAPLRCIWFVFMLLFVSPLG